MALAYNYSVGNLDHRHRAGVTAIIMSHVFVMNTPYVE